MYAIRSYYATTDLSMSEIEGGMDKHIGIAVTGKSRVIYFNSAKIQIPSLLKPVDIKTLSVITSYSIHYTKLYERVKVITETVLNKQKQVQQIQPIGTVSGGQQSITYWQVT